MKMQGASAQVLIKSYSSGNNAAIPKMPHRKLGFTINIRVGLAYQPIKLMKILY
jgi:hypothetical protein